MKKFLKKLCAAIFLVALGMSFFCGFILMVVAPQYSLGYVASVLDKIDRLESIQEPKIILVGNSNVAFGFDSAMLEEAMGMPVVNLGLHGGLGNKFHQNMAKRSINQGDIVVICHNDYGNKSEKIGDYRLAWITVENHFDLWSLIPADEWRYMISGFPDYGLSSMLLWLFRMGNKDPQTVYSRNRFNEYGDISMERTESTFEWTEGSVDILTVEEEGVESVNEFCAFCKERGAYVVIAGYPIGEGQYTPDHALYDATWAKLREKADCPVISNIEDYFFDYSLFYDTNLHLTTEGAQIRTKQLIKDLMGWKQENF